ncbi:hypothetical protein NL676_001044 [Syzygium grande]|nr:hypothetical protein NL676_001044 [Syzygium grande]
MQALSDRTPDPTRTRGTLPDSLTHPTRFATRLAAATPRLRSHPRTGHRPCASPPRRHRRLLRRPSPTKGRLKRAPAHASPATDRSSPDGGLAEASAGERRSTSFVGDTKNLQIHTKLG